MSVESDALNRIADALFQQAKATAKQNKLMERQIECTERMEEMQKANLAVTKHLEATLALQADDLRTSIGDVAHGRA